MKILISIILSIAGTMALADISAINPSQQLQKDMAQKYLDIAEYTADARENKHLHCDTGTARAQITQITLLAISAARSAVDAAFTDRILRAITSNSTLQKVVSSQVSYRFALATPTLGYTTAASRAALIGSTMYGPVYGVLGNISEISFGGDGSAKIVSKEYKDESGEIVYTTKYVAFSVGQNRNYQTVVTIDRKRYIMTQNSEGYVLLPENLEDPDHANKDAFFEFPSECDA